MCTEILETVPTVHVTLGHDVEDQCGKDRWKKKNSIESEGNAQWRSSVPMNCRGDVFG